MGLLAVLLVMVGLTRLILEERLPLAPTPTLTKARGATATPTPDFRATQNVEDLITQQALRVAQLGIRTPTPEPRPTATPTATPTFLTPERAGTASPEPTTRVTVVLPLVGGPGGETATPTLTPTSPTVQIETPTPLPAPATLTAEAAASATAAAFTPTPTATPTPTFTPLPPVVQPTATLRATVHDRGAVDVYAGPGVFFARSTALPANQAVILQGRTASGEWVYLCCEANVAGWVRTAFLRIQGNELPPDAPSNSNPNDVRWLAERTPTATPLAPQPTPTLVPDNDYPLFRRDPGAQARVNRPLLPPLRFGWPDPATASRSMSSPVIVVGSSVLVASQDQHLYSFDKLQGNQRWRYQFPSFVQFAPAAQDNLVYAMDQDGVLMALEDQGNRTPIERWRRNMESAPGAGLNLRGDLLFVPGVNHTLYALNRQDGGERWRFSTSGNYLHYPAIGDQLVYVGDATLTALDVYSGTVVWQNTAINGVSGPPVYSRPGVRALAELFVATELGGVLDFDANTGVLLWQHVSAERTTDLALDDTTVYAAGRFFVKALDRQTGQELWRYNAPDELMGGPIVGNGRLLIAFASGAVQILDAFRGVVLYTQSIPVRLAGPPAVSDGWIFVPGADGRLYSLRESG